MAVDAGIYGAIRAPQQVDPLDRLTRVMQVQGLQRQSQEADRALADQMAQREAVKGFGNDQAANYNRLLQTGNLKAAQDYQKANADTQKVKIDTEKGVGELLKKNATAVFANPTEQNAISAVEDFGRQTGQNTDKLKATVYALRGDPMAIKQWAGGHALDADKMLAKIDTRDTGGTVQTLATNPLTLQQSVVGQVAKTMTPGEIASNAVARGNLGLAQQRLGLEKQAREDGKWQYDAARGMQINNVTGETRPVLQNGQPIAQAGPKLTEDQGKATGWLIQADNAFKNMVSATDPMQGGSKSAAEPGFGDAVAATPLLGAVGNWLRSDNRQKFVQGADSLSEALLRAATGAGVNKDEAKQKVREITPQWGDSPSVIAQKTAAIPLYIDSLKVRAGPGSAQATAVAEKQPKSSAPTQFSSMPDPAALNGKRVQSDDGTIYKSNGKNWVRQ